MDTAVHAVFLVALLQPTGAAPVLGLSSPSVAARRVTLEALLRTFAASSTTRIDRDTQAAVVKLLETENALLLKNSAAVTAGGVPSIDEGYGDYYAVLVDVADWMRRATRGEPAQSRRRLLAALVAATYNPDSEFAIDLSVEGEQIVPYVVQLAASPNGPSRWNAHALIALLFEQHSRGDLSPALSPSSQNALRVAARAGLTDLQPDVRRHAIEAVVAAQDRDAIPLLVELAASDPDVGRGPMARGVRSLAHDALLRLKRMR